MTTLVSRPYRRAKLQSICIIALGLWISASLVFDFLIIPSLFASGMMESSDFASFSYIVFGNFNHLELLVAGIILGSSLAINYRHNLSKIKIDSSIVISVVLMAIALAYTYFFTPQLSSLGMNLDPFVTQELNVNPMIGTHLAYWMLELSKLVLGFFLLNNLYGNSCELQ